MPYVSSAAHRSGFSANPEILSKFVEREFKHVSQAIKSSPQKAQKAQNIDPVAYETPIADTFVVCSYCIPQCSPAVLDSTGNGEDAFTSTRWNTGSVEHLNALFSGFAVGGIFLRAGCNYLDGSSQASDSARRDPSSFMSLPAVDL